MVRRGAESQSPPTPYSALRGTPLITAASLAARTAAGARSTSRDTAAFGLERPDVQAATDRAGRRERHEIVLI